MANSGDVDRFHGRSMRRCLFWRHSTTPPPALLGASPLAPTPRTPPIRFGRNQYQCTTRRTAYPTHYAPGHHHDVVAQPCRCPLLQSTPSLSGRARPRGVAPQSHRGLSSLHHGWAANLASPEVARSAPSSPRTAARTPQPLAPARPRASGEAPPPRPEARA